MTMQEWDFEYTSRMFVEHENLSLANSQATIVRRSVHSSIQNPYVQ